MTRTSRILLLTWLATGGALAFGGNAFAQARAIALDGAIIFGRDARDDRLPSAVTGGGGAVLYQTAGRLWVAFEIDALRIRGYDIGGRTSRADGTTKVSYGRRTFRSTTKAVLLGIRFRPRSRLYLSIVTGGAIERRAFGQDLTVDTIDTSGVLLTHQVIDTTAIRGVFHWLAVPLGLDATIHLTERLSIVPQARLWWSPQIGDGCCTGPQTAMRLAARWTFK